MNNLISINDTLKKIVKITKDYPGQTIVTFIYFAIILITFSVKANENDSGYTSPTSKDKLQINSGRVTIDGRNIDYESVTGMMDIKKEDSEYGTAKIFYVAYFKKQFMGKENRPITFIYNGGPGSASLWLHIGAFGPKRAIIKGDNKNKLPYEIVNNNYSLLNVSDIVFIDAPGTGYSYFEGNSLDLKEKKEQQNEIASKAYGIHGDVQYFNDFITHFIADFQLWKSPKYLLGESYGTTRSAVLAESLKNSGINLDGIVLISPYLNYDNNVDDPEINPGYDNPYILSLPSYAATAWKHMKIPEKNIKLEDLLSEAESFAMSGYSKALLAGNSISEEDKMSTATRLYQLTGIASEVWLKHNLRMNGPVFAVNLLNDKKKTVGRLDSRYTAPNLESINESALFDPSLNVIIPVYTAAFNDYVGNNLSFNTDKKYKIFNDDLNDWDMSSSDRNRAFNVLPNLSRAMKYNSEMKVMVVSGIFDLATPYFTAAYDLKHLSITDEMKERITVKVYNTGHMPYTDEDVMEKFHKDLTAFYK